MTHMTTIGIGGKIDVQQAAKVIGCSGSTIVNLINKGKIKAQKINGQWWMLYEEVEKIRPDISPRPRREVVKQPALEPLQTTTLQFSLDKEKFEFIRMVCEVNGTTLADFVKKHLNQFYEKSKEKLTFDVNNSN